VDLTKFILASILRDAKRNLGFSWRGQLCPRCTAPLRVRSGHCRACGEHYQYADYGDARPDPEE
jgi:predicted amidophosphoribosyltransferase